MGLQVHGADVQVHDASRPSGRAYARPVPTCRRRTRSYRRADVTPLVLVADCVPLALSRARRGRRWSTAAGAASRRAIVERASRALASSRGADRASVHAALGPGIGACCYEVGDEVRAAFERARPRRRRSPAAMLDLPRAIARRARARCGVDAGAVADCGLCTSCNAELFFSHRRDGGVTGRQAGLVWLELVERARPGARAREPRRGARADRRAPARVPGATRGEVELLAATKYVPVELMGALAEAGVELVGENTAQDLVAKHERWGERFTFDFIGHLQSRKTKQVLPRVRLIHSVESESVLRQIERHAERSRRGCCSRSTSPGRSRKHGVAPDERRRVPRGRGRRTRRCGFAGLMTMPPLADRPRAGAAVLRRACASSPSGCARDWAPRPRVRGPLDGHEPGLRGRRRGGRDRAAAWAAFSMRERIWQGFFACNRGEIGGSLESVPDLQQQRKDPAHGPERHLAPRARLLRPRRGRPLRRRRRAVDDVEPEAELEERYRDR